MRVVAVITQQLAVDLELVDAEPKANTMPMLVLRRTLILSTSAAYSRRLCASNSSTEQYVDGSRASIVMVRVSTISDRG
jgi:hypothetical protein